MAGDEKRNSDGTFAKGGVGNPSGVNGHIEGYQRYGDRAAMLREKYTTKQIREFYEHPELLDDLPFYDGMILSHLARTIAGEEQGQERERLLNRTDGRPKQTVDLSMKGDLALHGLSESELKARIADKLGRLVTTGDAGDSAAAGGAGEANAADDPASVPGAVEGEPV